MRPRHVSYSEENIAKVLELSQQRPSIQPAEIAQRLALSVKSIYTIRTLLRIRGHKLSHGLRFIDTDAIDGLDDLSGERCKCGLRLPCNSCLPETAAEWAYRRKESYVEYGKRVKVTG